jgi:hypothetical protein
MPIEFILFLLYFKECKLKQFYSLLLIYILHPKHLDVLDLPIMQFRNGRYLRYTNQAKADLEKRMKMFP